MNVATLLSRQRLVWGNKYVNMTMQKNLEAIGDENILLQLDGYESYLNA